jgi:hypothetical protein
LIDRNKFSLTEIYSLYALQAAVFLVVFSVLLGYAVQYTFPSWEAAGSILGLLVYLGIMTMIFSSIVYGSARRKRRQRERS